MIGLAIEEIIFLLRAALDLSQSAVIPFTYAVQMCLSTRDRGLCSHNHGCHRPPLETN